MLVSLHLSVCEMSNIEMQFNFSLKTWTSRCLMKYYATVAATTQKCQQDTVERIERRVLDSNPIMEAFGKRFFIHFI